MNEEMKILLVEDNYEHVRLTMYILKQRRVRADIYVVRDGQQAIDYLYRRNEFSDVEDSPRPHLVLLDLNIPCVNGKEVLKAMKDDCSLSEIPVVVMSSSDREEDMAFADEMGAAGYISKSGGFEQLADALASIPKLASKE